MKTLYFIPALIFLQMNTFADGLGNSSRNNVSEFSDALSSSSLAPVLPKEATFENNEEDSTLYIIQSLAPKPPAEADFEDSTENTR